MKRTIPTPSVAIATHQVAEGYCQSVVHETMRRIVNVLWDDSPRNHFRNVVITSISPRRKVMMFSFQKDFFEGPLGLAEEREIARQLKAEGWSVDWAPCVRNRSYRLEIYCDIPTPASDE